MFKLRANLLEKISQSAEGIPDRNVFKSLPEVKNPTTWQFSLSKHDAFKAGPHFDLRLLDEEGNAHSWALRKGLPEKGEKRLAVLQPTHHDKSLDFEGSIPKGQYGGGDVKLVDRDIAEIIRSSPDQINFNVYKGRDAKEFSIIKTKDKNWLMINRAKEKDLPFSKPKYKETKIEKINPHDDSEVLTAKVDGAHGYLVLGNPGTHPRLYSYREGKRAKDIEHTFKIPELLQYKVPKELSNTVSRVEIFATDKKGKALPGEQVGGLLNSAIWKSREGQEQQGQLKIMPINPMRMKGKDLENASYKDKWDAIQKIVEKVPKTEMPFLANTAQKKIKLINDVVNKKLKQTEEGVIIHKWNEPAPFTKAKIRPDYDVHIREIFPGEGKYEGKAAGGFKYSLTPEGKVVGNVGTGFSDELRKDMFKNPESYVGKKVVVNAKGQYSSGALGGSPSFKRIHLDEY